MGLRVDLTASHVVINNGHVDGRPIGDVAVIGSALVSIGHLADACTRCGAPRVQQRVQRLFMVPLCAEHAYEGQWISYEQLQQGLKELRERGAAPGVAAAWFGFAVKRVRSSEEA